MSVDERDEEYRALLDTGANGSFISTRKVQELGLEIFAASAAVKNGDGSKQLSPGTVQITFSIGHRFKTTAQFRVINLDIFDMIIGMDLFLRHQFMFEYDPFRVSAICPGTHSRPARRVNLPLCLLSKRDEKGRDCSTYVCDNLELADVCRQITRREGQSFTEDDVLVLMRDDADCLSYTLLAQNIMDQAASSSHEEFISWSHALLSDLKGVRHDDETAVNDNGLSGKDEDVSERERESRFVAPSASMHSSREQHFKAKIAEDFPNLCSDSLPLDGPSATLPNGELYSVKLKLKPGIEPQGRRPFRIPEAYREELDNTISDLLKYKLIEPCESPYSNPIFLVPKPRRPDGSHAGMRLVWDGRGVNRAIESDSFLMPRVEDLIDRIARCKFEAERAGYKNMIFSGLDQRTSFWQLSLDEASRPLTAFSTSVGQYQWRCLPMGMLTSSAHLQRFTEALLRPFSRSNKFEYTNSAGERCVAYGTAVGYVDDIGVVTFGDIEAHEAYLRMVLGAMEASKLRIQPAKCEFFRTHGAFLGHVLSEEGISQQTSKLEAIKNWPELTDLKAVRAFVSLCSYYRKFIQNFAGIAQPLTDLMKKDAFKVPFSAEVLESIAALKSALTSAPVLSYFDSQKATELFVDASKFSIGAVLQQIDARGESHPIGYYSRRLNSAEQNYATYDKELLGLRDGVLHFRHYLLGIKFKVHTDHSSLRWLMTQPEVVGQRQRWLVVLSEFDMTEIAHIAGEKNVVADGLSRYPDPNGPSYEHLLPDHGNMDVRFANLNVRFTNLRLMEQDLLLHALFTEVDMTECYLTSTVTDDGRESGSSLLPTPIRLFHAPTPLPETHPEHVCRHCQSSTCDTLLAEFARHAIEPGLPEGVVNDPMLEHGFQEASVVEAQTDITTFVAAYADCPDFKKIYDDIKGLPLQETHDTWSEYSINERGLLLHRDGDTLRVCVPSSQRNLILRVMHDLPLGMHQGTAKMYALMATRFYFPKMAERVRAYIESCEHCQRNKAYTRNTRGVPRPSDVPFRRFDVMALDIVSGFPATKTGFDAIVVFTDRLTKRVYIEPCTKTASARDLALIFFRTVFRSQGMPRVLLSDNGPQFTSAFWSEFFSLLQTDIRLTSSYHPQSNGQTERFNRTLIEALRSFVNARHDNWDQFLVHFEFAYNSTVNASTGFSPFILQFAQAPRAPWDSVLEGGENDSNGPLSGGDLAFSLGFDTLKNLKQARASLQEAAQRQRVRNALLTRPHEYAVGDEVLLSTENIALRLPSRKLSPKFVGPFRIVELRGKNAVKIKPTGRFRALHDVINVEYLRPYNVRSENVGPPPHHLSVKPVAVEPLGEWYQIAEILDHRGKAGPAQQCLVRWEGFDASHDSWVPRRDITPKALVAYEEFLREAEPRQKPHDGHVSRKRLSSFIGEHGEHSVIENSDNRRTSKISVPRGEREKADDRRNGVEHPKVSATVSQSASDTGATAAAGGGRARKPPGFYRV